MKKRQKKDKTDEQKQLDAYRKKSHRHVLVLETDLSYQDKCQFFALAERERKASNALTAIMQNNSQQLLRTKRYRKLKTLYGVYLKKDDKDNKKLIADQMAEMQKQYGVTWDVCRETMKVIGKQYHISSIFALTTAEDVWQGVEKLLYANGDRLHFTKYGELPGIRAKQFNRGIPVKNKNGHLHLSFENLRFGVLIKDRFEQDTINLMLDYLKTPEIYDRLASTAYLNGQIIDTFRPCYVTLMCKMIRGKMRVYAHITIEGKALPKYNKMGQPKHHFGVGPVGCDIGTQTIAYTSNTAVGLKNLAERGSSIQVNERQERLLKRAMDRSRRATNPQNYNADGTIKKGHKTWTYSKRYQRLKQKYRELCRINAINRKLAINQDVNYLRSLGDVFITEPKNAKKLKKRAKKTTVNEKTGKFNKKARFGKSIQNRCPGYFQAQIQRKFEQTGGSYYEVPNNYKASQYDHLSDTYIPKKLSQRMYNLSDGTLVQRDWYSSFLLYNADIATLTIDKSKCRSEFAKQYQRQLILIENIKENHLKILNSGIRVA